MCDPTIISGVGLFISTAATVGGAVMKGKAAQDAATLAAKNATLNAAVTDAQSAAVLQAGASEAAHAVQAGRRTQASALAAIGKSGVGASSLENLNVATALSAELAADQAKAGAARLAWGLDAETEASKRLAERSKKAGFLGSLSAGISAGGSIASSFGSLKIPA